MADGQIVSVPLVEFSDIETNIEKYLLGLFLKYKETDIPGEVTMNIKVTAHSGARELEIIHECSVGDYANRQTFKSNSMTNSLKKACERYKEQQQHRVLAISATPSDMPF